MTRAAYLCAAPALLVLLAIGAANTARAACDEVGYIATFEVKPGSEQAFERAIVAVARKVNEVEEGVLLYAPFRGESGRYYMMERYRNLQAREVHATAPEVLDMFPPIMELLTVPIAVEPLAALCGAGD